MHSVDWVNLFNLYVHYWTNFRRMTFLANRDKTVILLHVIEGFGKC